MRQAVLLAGVAGSTGGHHVLPCVRAALAARDDVVEVLCRCPAVLTRAGVPGEDRAPVDRHPVVAWDLHVADQTDDRRFGDADPLRPKHPLGGMDQLCSGVEHQE